MLMHKWKKMRLIRVLPGTAAVLCTILCAGTVSVGASGKEPIDTAAALSDSTPTEAETAAHSQVSESRVSGSESPEQGVFAPGSERAAERAADYAQAVNYDYETPEKIYAFLTEELRGMMTEAEFTEAFKKERSYPYITPLYLMKNPEIELALDGLTGTVIYAQAARITGMTYEIGLVYENGDYYIEDWMELADGSYLEKFEDCPYTLDWYYDLDEASEE